MGAGAAAALETLDDAQSLLSLGASILGSFDAADLHPSAADLAGASTPHSPRRFNRRGQRAPLDTPRVNSATLQVCARPARRRAGRRRRLSVAAALRGGESQPGTASRRAAARPLGRKGSSAPSPAWAHPPCAPSRAAGPGRPD